MLPFACHIYFQLLSYHFKAIASSFTANLAGKLGSRTIVLRSASSVMFLPLLMLIRDISAYYELLSPPR